MPPPGGIVDNVAKVMCAGMWQQEDSGYALASWLCFLACSLFLWFLVGHGLLPPGVDPFDLLEVVGIVALGVAMVCGCCQQPKESPELTPAEMRKRYPMSGQTGVEMV